MKYLPGHDHIQHSLLEQTSSSTSRIMKSFSLFWQSSHRHLSLSFHRDLSSIRRLEKSLLHFQVSTLLQVQFFVESSEHQCYCSMYFLYDLCNMRNRLHFAYPRDDRIRTLVDSSATIMLH